MKFDPISAEAYNRIPLLEEQPQVPLEGLRALGTLFTQHEVNGDWGIALLHRHVELPLGVVMVHTQNETGTDVCEPQTLQFPLDSRIAPRLLLLDHSSKFQAYEYDLSDRQPDLFSTFLCELRDLLSSLGLEKLLALEANLKSDCLTSVETMLVDGTGKVRGTRSDPSKGWQDMEVAVPTSWTFRKGLDVEILVSKECVTLPTGLHVIRNS